MKNFTVRSRRSWWTGMLAGAAVPVALSLAGSVSFGGFSTAWASAAAPSSPASTSQDQRIRELEERIKILELEQETQERRLRLEIERHGRAFEEIDRRVRALEERAGQPAESAAVSQAERAAALEAMCREPFIQGAPGIRKVKPGCESSGKECDAPEAVDSRGVRRVLPGCIQSIEKERGVCDPPYFFDDKGVKRVKSECM
jgi:hypothetical protein